LEPSSNFWLKGQGLITNRKLYHHYLFECTYSCFGLQDIWFVSQTEQGIEEDQPGVHPSVLNQYYGVEGLCLQRCPGQTGAGHEDGDVHTNASNDLASSIADEQQSDICHEPIKVPAKVSPFDPETEKLFFAALHDVQ